MEMEKRTDPVTVFAKKSGDLFAGNQFSSNASVGSNFYVVRYDERNVMVNYVRASAGNGGTRSAITKTMSVAQADNLSLGMPLPLSEDLEVMQVLCGSVNPTAEEKETSLKNIFDYEASMTVETCCRRKHKLGIVFLQNSDAKTYFKSISSMRDGCLVLTIPAYARLLRFVVEKYEEVKLKMSKDLKAMNSVKELAIDSTLKCIGTCLLTYVHCLDARRSLKLWLVLTMSPQESQPKVHVRYEHQNENTKFPLNISNLVSMAKSEALWSFLKEYDDCCSTLPVISEVNSKNPAENGKPKTPLKEYELQQHQQQQEQQSGQQEQQAQVSCSEILSTAMKDIFDSVAQPIETVEALQQQQPVVEQEQTQVHQAPQPQYYHQQGHQQQHYQQQQNYYQKRYQQSGEQHYQPYSGYLTSAVVNRSNSYSQGQPQNAKRLREPIPAENNADKRSKLSPTSCYSSSSSMATSQANAKAKMDNGQVALSFATATSPSAQSKSSGSAASSSAKTSLSSKSSCLKIQTSVETKKVAPLRISKDRQNEMTKDLFGSESENEFTDSKNKKNSSTKRR